MITRLVCAGALLITNAGSVSLASAEDLAIRANSIRAHLEYLASDLMEGREAGTRGYDLAAGYVASIYQQIGLQPAGTHGYFQPVPLRKSVLVPGSIELTVSGPGGTRTFTGADHVAARPSATEAEQRIEASC